MKKFNKKGFTLIEMLVVIAIIAVLVSIVVPAVSNSTVKAAASTNAANLRTAAAELSIKYLDDATKFSETSGVWSYTGSDFTAPTPRDVKVGSMDVASSDTNDAFKFEIVNGEMKCYFGTFGVADFADVADDGLYNKSVTGSNGTAG